MIQHPEQWKQLQSAWLNQRIAQSMLFVGPLHNALTDFVRQLAQLLLCKQSKHEPCLTCLDCRMTAAMEHPDLAWIKPEKNVLRIEQIRELQQTVCLTPQRSSYRVIVIEAADKMNAASANALLKSLEEPPKHSIFILTAQQVGTILPTILSRCQILTFSSSKKLDYLLMLGEEYPVESDRFLIVQRAEGLLDGLIAILEGREHPCTIALLWSQFELGTSLWFLYLVYAQLQNRYSICAPLSLGPATHQLTRLSSLLQPILIFNQIDKINILLGKVNQNIPINPGLALEDLFLSIGLL